MGELAEDVAVPSAVMAEVMAGTELQPRPLVEKLLRNGAYLSEHLVEAALADVGE
jgi:hypothetical protein